MTRFFAIVSPLTVGSMLILWCTAGHATDRHVTIKDLGNGSVEVCKYETDFVVTKDGSNMVRTAWVCTTSKLVK